MTGIEDEWLWGWDPTPGIVSVHAEPSGRAIVWRRLGPHRLVREETRFRPWILLASLEDLRHLGTRLQADGAPSDPRAITYSELSGEGSLRFLLRASDLGTLTSAVLEGARRRTGRALRHVNDLGETNVLLLAPEEQYLVDSGRTYFRDLDWEALQRLQFDLETTGLDPMHDRIFLIAVRTPDGQALTLESARLTDASEADLIEQLLRLVQECDPDVIENHNLHGFDLPFLVERARRLRVPVVLGRNGRKGLGLRSAATGRGIRIERTNGDEASEEAARPRRLRYTTEGRELIDTLDAVRRHDFAARDLPGHGLKAVARKLGLASSDREYLRGEQVYAVYRQDPERVRRYAKQDVVEAAGVAQVLGGAAFALARMAPRRYERLADAGPATGVLDPLIVRAYLHAGAALPAHQPGDGTTHSGAALYLFGTGVAQRIVKADVASLYPSLMRQFRIGPARDRLGVMLALVDRLVEQRLRAKRRARELPAGTAERFAQEALSAAMKIVINSAYGYLGAVGLTRFSDVHAANEVTRRGRDLLAHICRELDRRGMTLLEADTDGVYFAVPEDFTEADERRVVAEVAALLPPLVQLEFEGRYAAMLSHEPKNYALLPYSGPVVLRGVAFRSSRAEPFGEAFLRRAIEYLLRGDVIGVRRAYVDAVLELRDRSVPTARLSMLVRLTKTPEQYRAVRASRREFAYEALIQSGAAQWRVGQRARVYRAMGGRPALLPSELEGSASTFAGSSTQVGLGSGPARDSDGGSLALATIAPNQAASERDPRDYDAEYYVNALRVNFATRLERALEPEHFDLVFADPRQPSLFTPLLAMARPRLTRLSTEELLWPSRCSR